MAAVKTVKTAASDDLEGCSPQSNPGSDADTSPSATPRFAAWRDVDFSSTDAGIYPPELLECERWMGRLAGTKTTFAPWSDRDHPDADADEDARFKWGISDNYVDGHKMGDLEPAYRKRGDLDGRVFIQLEDDQFTHVDGDDVRCPETSAVHPAFIAILEHLGLTYADVSTSGSGIHAHYTGELPIDGKTQATIELDTEPWGANEDVPSVEFHAGKRLCVTTGEHVRGTPLELVEWAHDALRCILEANGYHDRPEVSHDTDREREELLEYQPTATGLDATTEDVRDVLTAVDRLRPQHLPLQAQHTGDDATGWETWNPSYRSSESGESVHRPPDESVFYDHKEGEAFGILGLIAAEHGIISKPWDRLEGVEWWEAVDAARDAGAPIPEYVGKRSDPNAEPVAVLSPERLEALDECSRDRALAKLDVPSTNEIRTILRDALMRELRAGNRTVLDVPTSGGKTATTAREPWLRRTSTTGDVPVIHLHQTREARDQAAAESREVGVSHRVLQGRREASPLARGDHDPPADENEEPPEIVVTIDGEPASDWFDEMCDRRGLPFSMALAIARERNDQGLEELPPIGAEDPAVAQWDGIPRTDEGEPAVDVIHATHQFAYVPSLRAHTNLILDEQPDFTEDLTQDRIRRMVGAYLREVGAPVTTWEAFVTLATHDAHDTDAARERDALADYLDKRPPREWYVEDPDAHALAADLSRAIYWALRKEDPDVNGRRRKRVFHEPPRFDVDGEGGYGGVWLSVVIGEPGDEYAVRTVRATPDFRQARSVIGLDAHPCMPRWQLNTEPDMVRDAVLDPTERRLWRRYERGLTVVGVSGGATRPRSGEKAREWTNEERIREICTRLRDHYGEGFRTAIATKQVEPLVRQALQDAGAEDVDTMHYGEEKSRNDFAGEPAGYVYGCMDPGDGMILDALAELDLVAQPVTVETEDGETKREKGRAFTGPDADAADDVLASVRENHAAQAPGRYARNPDDPEDTAVVYVDTDAAPAGFVDLEVPGVEWLASDRQREIIDALADRPSATTREIAAAVGCSKNHVRDTLERLVDRGLVDRHRGGGKHGADVYRDAGVETAVVDLRLEQIANDRLKDLSRWSLAIRDRHEPEEAPTADMSPLTPPAAPADGPGPPPDSAD